MGTNDQMTNERYHEWVEFFEKQKANQEAKSLRGEEKKAAKSRVNDKEQK